MRRRASQGSASYSEGDESEGSDFDAPPLPRVVTLEERAALTRATVGDAIRLYVNHAWTVRAGQFEVASALWRQESVVCTFPTSAGKTLIMMLGALLDFHHNTLGTWIVCQPLEALRRTTASKVKAEFFANTTVEVVMWDRLVLKDTDAPFDAPSESVTAILCSPEQLGAVFGAVRRHADLVRSLLVDEAHLRFAWEFRDYRTSDQFSTLFPRASIGLFSATLDPSDTNEFVRLMAMRDVSLFTETTFPHLQDMKLRRWDQFSFRCIPIGVDFVVAAIVDLFSRLPKNNVVIIFASSYAKLSRLVEPLGREILRPFNPRMYNSSYPSEHKELTCKQVNSGHCRLVGATSALGAGVDLLNVGAIVFFGCPRRFSDATQGMGRAGRSAEMPPVDVIFASDSGCNSKIDNKMRLLMGYCSETKPKPVRCSVCQHVNMRPSVRGAEDSYMTCFDIIGVHCGRNTRPACKRTMCKFFDGLLKYEDLADSSYDCKRCDSCVKTRIALPIGCLVKYKGKNAVVWGETSSHRKKIREEDSGANHTVEEASLSIVSLDIRAPPPVAELNKLSNTQRRVLHGVLRRKFSVACAGSGGILLSCSPSDVMLASMAKWSATECAARCPIRFSGEDMQAWFESAHTEALGTEPRKPSEDDDGGSEGSGGNEDNEEESSSSDESGEGSDAGDEGEASGDGDALEESEEFVLDIRFAAYFQANADKLRRQMVRDCEAAEHEVAARKRALEDAALIATPKSGSGVPSGGHRKAAKGGSGVLSGGQHKAAKTQPPVTPTMPRSKRFAASSSPAQRRSGTESNRAASAGKISRAQSFPQLPSRSGQKVGKRRKKASPSDSE